MKKKHFILTFISGAFLLTGISTVSCGPSEHEKAMQAELDSIHRADSIARQKSIADSIKKAEMMNFSTPDLSMFNLKGHVKSAVISHTSYYTGTEVELTSFLSAEKLNYDAEGNLERIGAWILTGKGNGNYKPVRDSKGRLQKLMPNPVFSPEEPEYGAIKFHYNNNGYPATIEEAFDDGATMSATFNDDGLPVQVRMRSYGEMHYKYTYTDFDSYGNWIKRKVNYIHEAVYDNETSVNTTFTETRQIKYYE